MPGRPSANISSTMGSSRLSPTVVGVRSDDCGKRDHQRRAEASAAQAHTCALAMACRFHARRPHPGGDGRDPPLMYGTRKRRLSPETVRRGGQIVLYLLWPLVLALVIVLMVAAIYFYE